MLTQQTFEKLYTMKPNGMTDAFGQQQEDTEIASLSFEERFGLLVDQQWIWKENRALARCLAGAKFKLSAAGRRHRLPSCERSRPQAVAQPHQRAELGAAASQHFLLGPTGIGKVIWPVLWHARLAATASRRSTGALPNCSGTWPWHAPTAVCRAACRGWLASTDARIHAAPREPRDLTHVRDRVPFRVRYAFSLPMRIMR